jgi:hypothetical protein
MMMMMMMMEQQGLVPEESVDHSIERVNIQEYTIPMVQYQMEDV